MQTTYDQFVDITTATITGGAFVTTDDTPSGNTDKLWLKQAEPAENCMPKGWYIYDANMGGSGGWRNFMSTPAGSLQMYGGASAPEGWLLCDGTAYSTTSNPEYEDLYAVIANTYGGNDGSDFKVPDFKGRTPVGSGTGSGLTARAMGATGGTESHTIEEDELPDHTHTVPYQKETNIEVHGSSETTIWEIYPGDGVGAGGATGTVDTGGTGLGTAIDKMSPFVVVNYLIKF